MRNQPQGRAVINMSHPLARGLAGFWLPNGGRLASAITNIPSGVLSPNARITPAGDGLWLDTVSGRSAAIQHDSRIKPANAITVLLQGRTPSNNGGYAIGCETTNNGWGIYANATAITSYLRVGGAWASRPANVVSGNVAQVGFSFDGSTFTAIGNGEFAGSQSVSGAVTNSGVSIGLNARNGDGAGTNGNGAYSYLAIWDRALSAEELAIFYANPWQLFSNPDEDDYAAAALNSYALSVTPTSLLLNDCEVGMRVSRRVGVQPAALAVVGSEVSLRAARKLAAQSAALELSAGAASLKAARRASVNAAGLVLQQGDARLRTARRLIAAPAAMSIAGGAIQFQLTPAPTAGSYVMPVTSALLSLSGGNVGMRVTRRLPVSAASLSMTAGQAHLLAARRLLASPAGLAIMSGPALLRGSRRLQVEPAQMLVAGGSVTLRYSQQVEYARAPAGSGYSPQRIEVQARPAQVGSFRPASIQRNDR